MPSCRVDKVFVLFNDDRAKTGLAAEDQDEEDVDWGHAAPECHHHLHGEAKNSPELCFKIFKDYSKWIIKSLS